MPGQERPLTCPPEVLAAIPWYPDDLDRAEREAVESHASECLDCRRELEARIADPGQEADWPRPDADETFTRVMARIELGEADELREWARAPRRTRAVRWLRESEVRVPGFAQPVSVGRGLSVAASFGAVVAAASLFLGAGPNGHDPGSLSEPAAIVQQAPRIDVVFRGDLTTAEMFGALDGIRGTIKDGPSPGGRYVVELEEGANAGAAAKALSDSGVALYAEPTAD